MRRLPGFAVAACGMVVATGLAGCSGMSLGALPGGSPASATTSSATPAPGDAAPAKSATQLGSSSKLKTAGCKPNGTSIPNGEYVGTVDYVITTTLTITDNGVSIPNAGGGKEHWQGTVDLVSKGGKVTGTMNMEELGISQVGLDGSVQVHSVENSGFTGSITGPASAPTVSGTGTGSWDTAGAPGGTATSSLSGGLHITKADCSSITGDAVAMFADFTKPVAQYLSVSGPATWVASRK